MVIFLKDYHTQEKDEEICFSLLNVTCESVKEISRKLGQVKGEINLKCL